MYSDQSVNLIVGKTIKNVQKTGDELTFVCTDGSAFRAYHMQDCCEYVAIHDIAGDLQSLVGKTISSALEDISHNWQDDVDKDSEGMYVGCFTWTTYVFEVEDHVVRVRWLGESNGYYSESVYFQRTHEPIELETDVEGLEWI